MKGLDIEIIISRQLADSLVIPVFITDTDGTLLFYNTPAEEILGKKFSETGKMKVEVWSSVFKPFDDSGKPLDPNKLPLVHTLTEKIPAHGSFWIESLVGEKHKISVTSIPLIGRGNRFVGAVAIFWKT
jgi:PAS domain-containing protein